MKTFLTGTALILCISTGAQAQGLTFKSATATLGYEQFTYSSGTDVFSRSFSTTVDIGIGDKFGVSAAINTHDLSDYPDETYYSATLRPYYVVNSSLEVGAFVEHNIDKYGAGVTVNTVYGLDFDFVSPTGIAVTGFFGRGQDITETNADFAGLTVGYGFENGFDIGAYAKSADVDGSDHIIRSGLTAGYLFSGNVLPVPVYLSGYIGKQNEGSNSNKTLGMNLTIPIGNAKLGKGQRPSALSHDAHYEYYD
ncbi:MAG: hypothetical protein ABI459_07675 [Deltaproteobacteria bacterium]